MKYLPNILSLSRIPLSIALFVFSIQEMWIWATAFFMIALVTDALDGFIARRFHVESDLGSNVLEPVCDLILSIAAVAGLYFGGAIHPWLPIGLIVITVLLQVSHSTPLTSLKRHTFYLHPLFFLATVFYIGGVYLVLSFIASGIGTETAASLLVLGVYLLVWFVAAYFKRERLKTWFAGPPATT